MTPAKPTLYGVGLGPGDPELLTLKAQRLISTAPVLAYINSSKDGQSMARQIAAQAIAAANAPPRELSVVMPMHKNRTEANVAYDHLSTQIVTCLQNDQDVVFLCEGDPFFFGSFAYIHQRLCDDHPVQVVPGITAIHAAAAANGTPLSLLSEAVATVSGRHDDQTILNALEHYDSVAIMKAGPERPRLLKLLEQAGRSKDASYLEYIGHPQQRIVTDITVLSMDKKGPYFSLFLVNHERPTNFYIS